MVLCFPESARQDLSNAPGPRSLRSQLRSQTAAELRRAGLNFGKILTVDFATSLLGRLSTFLRFFFFFFCICYLRTRGLWKIGKKLKNGRLINEKQSQVWVGIDDFREYRTLGSSWDCLGPPGIPCVLSEAIYIENRSPYPSINFPRKSCPWEKLTLK